jgi:hypothetical protein
MSEYFGFNLSIVRPPVVYLSTITAVSLDIESLAKERTEVLM